MKASAYFFSLALLLTGCNEASPEIVPGPQAVRVVEVRRGPMTEGRRYLAEVVPERSVRVLAQVPGTVSELLADEGAPVVEGAPLARVSAPDVAARASRVRAERRRAERERDFACGQLDTDRVLAEAGDLTHVALERSETTCASAGLAVQAARAVEREASVASSRAEEQAPFDGVVLARLVDEGQTVMPGTPLVHYGSQERRLRMRVPVRDLEDIDVGTRVESEIGGGRVVEIGAEALGPGRLVEVLAALDDPSRGRVGAAITATVVVAHRDDASAVPLGAVAQDDDGSYVLVVEDDRLRRAEVERGPRADGWVAIEPALPAGTRVASEASATLGLDRPVLAVSP